MEHRKQPWLYNTFFYSWNLNKCKQSLRKMGKQFRKEEKYIWHENTKVNDQSQGNTKL